MADVPMQKRELHFVDGFGEWSRLEEQPQAGALVAHRHESLGNRVARHHAAGHMVGDMTVK